MSSPFRDPSQHWLRQIGDVLRRNEVALNEGCGLTVVLQVRPDGKIVPAKCTQQGPEVDKSYGR